HALFAARCIRQRVSVESGEARLDAARRDGVGRPRRGVGRVECGARTSQTRARGGRIVTIVVCPLSLVDEMVAEYAPERVVSVLDPAFEFPDLGATYRDRHLKLRFHDIHVATEAEQVLPSTGHARELVAFIGAWRRRRPLLVHCRAGVGRSTATAFIA